MENSKKYFAFLRGINISGKNKVPMAQLKELFEKTGMKNVVTYLNSGNVSFDSEIEIIEKIREKIEEIFKSNFPFDIPVYVIGAEDLKIILSNAPDWWGNEKSESYDNLIFILSGDRPQTVCELVGEPSEGLEKIEVFGEVIFWSFDRKAYQKCNWWKKTASAGIGEKLTIRTANTIKRVCKND